MYGYGHVYREYLGKFVVRHPCIPLRTEISQHNIKWEQDLHISRPNKQCLFSAIVATGTITDRKKECDLRDVDRDNSKLSIFLPTIKGTLDIMERNHTKRTFPLQFLS